jgi:hypothetical protein
LFPGEASAIQAQTAVQSFFKLGGEPLTSTCRYTISTLDSFKVARNDRSVYKYALILLKTRPLPLTRVRLLQVKTKDAGRQRLGASPPLAQIQARQRSSVEREGTRTIALKESGNPAQAAQSSVGVSRRECLLPFAISGGLNNEWNQRLTTPAVGPRDFFLRHPIRTRLLLWRYILSAAVQAESMACVVGDRVWCRKSLGGS